MIDQSSIRREPSIVVAKSPDSSRTNAWKDIAFIKNILIVW